MSVAGALFSVSIFITGGSWKKSPNKIIWTTTNGSELCLISRQTASIIERVSGGSMDTSSMIRTFVRRTRFAICLLDAILLRPYLSKLVLIPMPLHEWIVIPPICVAAIPVEAVIAGSMSLARKYVTYLLIVCVLPDPGSPVKKTFAPVFNIDNA